MTGGGEWVVEEKQEQRGVEGVGLGHEGVREKSLEERYPGISEMGLCMVHDTVGVFYILSFATLILFCIHLLVRYFVMGRVLPGNDLS